MKKTKVIIVDDVSDVLDLFAQIFINLDSFSLLATSTNTWDARRLIYKNRPDLVLLDELIEGESSYDFSKEMSEVEALPIVLMSGMENPTHSISEYALGRIKKPSWEGDLKKTSKNLELELTKLLTKGR